MARSTLLLVLLGLACLAFVRSAPVAESNPEPELEKRQGDFPTCANPRKRKEWRMLTNDEKLDYLNAVKCLINKQGTYTNIYGMDRLTRFEDFVYVHKDQTAYVHFVGHFLAWHRYMIHLYEKYLIDECGFKGTQPYWDQQLDYRNSSLSPVFDVTNGFGGNGAPTQHFPQPGGMPVGTGGGCISTGPFKDMKLRIAKMSTPSRQDHCLDRDINPGMTSYWYTPQRYTDLMVQKDYLAFVSLLEGQPAWERFGIHGAGHGTVGGTMSDPFVSPSDPLFYMHHGNLDRIWFDWQHYQGQESTRLHQIMGNSVPWNNFLGPDLSKIPFKGNTTLDFPLSMGKLGPEIKIKDLIDTRGTLTCYEYVKA